MPADLRVVRDAPSLRQTIDPGDLVASAAMGYAQAVLALNEAREGLAAAYAYCCPYREQRARRVMEAVTAQADRAHDALLASVVARI